MLILFTIIIQLHCLTSLYIHKNNVHSNRVTTNRGLCLTSNNQFSLENYSQVNLIHPKSPIKINFVFTPNIPANDDISSSIKDLPSSTVILTSLGVRRLDDIVAANPHIMDLDKLSVKLKQNQQDISSDKFLYSHDVGSSCIHKVSKVRHPII